MDLIVELGGETITRTNLGHLYWTFAQQLAHLTSNGARTRPGDLFASGTVSGSGPGSQGSLIELTEGGRRPLRLADGSERTFLTDGDRVQIRGWCGQGEARVGLGTCTGTVVP
jgi:fumarylacetoacetase